MHKTNAEGEGSRNSRSTLEAALSYHGQGLSVIPLRPGAKIPPLGFRWKEWTRVTTTKAQIERWFADSGDSNIAIRCGEVSSNLVVLDVDPRADGDKSILGKQIPPTATVQTGGGGWHYYFRSAQQVKCRKVGPGLDLKGDGGYVVAPPSRHPSGGTYEWIDGLGPETPLAELPGWILASVSGDPAEIEMDPADSQIVLLLQPHWREGFRNDLTLALCGYLAKARWTWKRAEAVISRLASTDPERESRLANVKRTYRRLKDGDRVRGFTLLDDLLPADVLLRLGAMLQKEEGKGGTHSRATDLVRLAEKAELFHDEHQDAFAAVPVDSRREIWPCESKTFRRWLGGTFYVLTRQTPDAASIKDAVETISWRAATHGVGRELHNRITKHESSFYYDLSDREWRAVRISEQGIEIVAKPPILFRRYQHQQGQVEPTAGGSLVDLLEVFNLPDRDQQILAQVYVVTCLVPEIAHPISVFHGDHGSAKSSHHRLIRQLLDPSSIDFLMMPHDPYQLAQQLAHNYYVCYDNLSTLSASASDMLCRAVTGDAISKRKLFSDDEDVIYKYRRCVGLNGINLVAERPDLLDRSLLFALPRISEERRRTEDDLATWFAERRPRLVGAILTALSAAMRLVPSIKLSGLPRMADFTVWGCAVAESIGYSREDFLRAYYSNIGRQHDEVIASDNTASYLVRLMTERESWSGKAAELFGAMLAMAKADDLDPHRLGLPKAPNALIRKLNVLRNTLAAVGIQIESHKGDVTICRVQGNISRIEVSPLPPEIGGPGDISLTSQVVEDKDCSEPTKDE